jgi:hypothetical protein
MLRTGSRLSLLSIAITLICISLSALAFVALALIGF